MPVRDWLSPNLQAAGIDRVLAPGQALFRLGDRTAGIYEILRGQVQMVRVDASGREVVLYAAAAGELFAEAALFAPIYYCDAVTRTGATVRLYPKDKVLAELRRNPQAADPRGLGGERSGGRLSCRPRHFRDGLQPRPHP
jgi:CRP-like cAMP-binding protein